MSRVADLEAANAAVQAALDEANARTVPEPGESDLDGDVNAALTDAETGLFNEQFFRVTLETRVSAARRHLRPVAVVVLLVARGVREGATSPTEPAVVTEGVRATLRDADTACRLDDGRFALILEDTPENGAVWTVERIRRALAGNDGGHTLWAGIALLSRPRLRRVGALRPSRQRPRRRPRVAAGPHRGRHLRVTTVDRMLVSISEHRLAIDRKSAIVGSNRSKRSARRSKR